jgi:hypothetical protein
VALVVVLVFLGKDQTVVAAGLVPAKFPVEEVVALVAETGQHQQREPMVVAVLRAAVLVEPAHLHQPVRFV